jgi:mono/diheme cytochrome c family protein
MVFLDTNLHKIKHLNMRQFPFLITIICIIAITLSCGEKKKTTDAPTDAPQSMVADPASYDPNRGVGKFSPENLVIDAKLNESIAGAGEKIIAVKCTSCHKTTEEKLVGPGWKGVTTRRTPHWIMNFITNPDPMIDKDPALQAQLELCLVRMPNQSLKDDEARSIVEFMRKNDGVK